MDKSRFSRRDFLKLLSILPISTKLGIQQKFHRARHLNKFNKDLPNFLIIVFDAFSATNMSLHGYGRGTTPHLEKLATQANVYHNHYSTANFTIPGTASLLTGTYPWSHRAFNHEGSVTKNFITRNIFMLFSQLGYYTTAFSQNIFSQWLLHQFKSSIDVLFDWPSFHLADEGLNLDWFSNDFPLADKAKFLYRAKQSPTGYFRFLIRIANLLYSRKHQAFTQALEDDFPRGIPETLGQRIIFLLEDVIDEIVDHINTIPQPFMGYVHFWPPHEDYKTRKEFIDIFQDEIDLPHKPEHNFTQDTTNEQLNENRRFYDEYIPYVDSEFNRMFNILKHEGILDNTILILTSDHGEMFERGISGHVTEVQYQPLIRIPLLVFSPGQTERKDFYENTSSVDLLPTLLKLSEQEIPDWIEGKVLPGFTNNSEGSRSIFAMDAKRNSKFLPLTTATLTIIRDQYKLSYYMGYEDFEDWFEFYDLENDPEELKNIYSEENSIAQDLKTELLAKLAEVN